MSGLISRSSRWHASPFYELFCLGEDFLSALGDDKQKWEIRSWSTGLAASKWFHLTECVICYFLLQKTGRCHPSQVVSRAEQDWYWSQDPQSWVSVRMWLPYSTGPALACHNCYQIQEVILLLSVECATYHWSFYLFLFLQVQSQWRNWEEEERWDTAQQNQGTAVQEGGPVHYVCSQLRSLILWTISWVTFELFFESCFVFFFLNLSWFWWLATLCTPWSWQKIVSTTAPERAVLSVLSLGVALWTGQSAASKTAENMHFLSINVIGFRWSRGILFWLWLSQCRRWTAPVDNEIQRKMCDMLGISALKGYQMEALEAVCLIKTRLRWCVCRRGAETLRVSK